MRFRMVVLGALVVACGGSNDDSGSDSGLTASGAIDCSTDAWDIDAEMDWKQAWMTECMVPVMKPLFQEHDATRFANFGCDTCHGTDFNEGTFEMPNGPELDWMTSADWPADYYDANAFTGFMGTVVGEAATTLGYEPFSTESPEGFGCGGCHVGL